VQSRTVRTALRDQAHVVYWTVALFLAISGVAMVLKPRLYGGSGSVLVSPTAFLDPSTTDSLPELSATLVDLATRPAVLRGTAAAYTQLADGPEAAARRRDVTDRWLRRHIELQPVGTSSVLEVSAKAPRPDDARDLAAAEMSSLQRFVNEARPTPAGSDRDDPGGIKLLIVSASRQQGLVSPRPLRDTGVALVIGLITGCALVMLRSRRQRRPPRRLAAALGVPWLGTFSPSEAGTGAREFLQNVAASQRRVGHVTLITGASPDDATDRVATATVLALNERATRGLLVDGELGARALRRLVERPAAAGLPASAERGAWSTPPARADQAQLTTWSAIEQPDARRPSGELAAGGTARSHLWPDFEFVILSGPDVVRASRLGPLLGAMHCVVVLVGPTVWPGELEAIRALARDAESVRAVVGIMGIADSGSQLRSSA
jgi:hypothetical protein